MSGVLGPGGRGVVVLAEAAHPALRGPLATAGFPSVTPVEAGLSVQAAAAAALNHGEELARFFALATRRPAIARDDDTWAVAGADGTVLRGDDPVPLCATAATSPPPRVAVFGGAWIEEDEPEYEAILHLGHSLAERRTHLVCGGYQGAMAAACRGVAQGSGISVGVTMSAWEDMVKVNPWVTHELIARDLFARLPVITDADAWVAFSGGVGTLHEVALCWNLVQTGLAEPRPLLLVGERWDRQLRLFRDLLLVSDPAHFDLVRSTESVDALLDVLR